MYLAPTDELVTALGISEQSAHRYVSTVADLQRLKQRQTSSENASHAAEYFHDAFDLLLRTTCEFRAAHYNADARSQGDPTLVIARPQIVKPYSTHIPLDIPECTDPITERMIDYHGLLKRFYKAFEKSCDFQDFCKAAANVIADSQMLPIFIGSFTSYGLADIPLKEAIKHLPPNPYNQKKLIAIEKSLLLK